MTMTAESPVVSEALQKVTGLALTEHPGTRRGVWRLVLSPVRLIGSMISLAFRTGVGVGGLPVRVGAAVSRRLGVVGTVCLILGVATGLLIAPTSGRQLRHRLRQLLSGRGRNSGGPAPEVHGVAVEDAGSGPEAH